MHAIIFNLCAYMLLLSSVITIVVLSRKQFWQWKSTSLYILSVSDVLFSIFTSSVLIINCAQQITCISYKNLTNSFLINTNIWTEEPDNMNQRMKVTSFYEKCDIINILMKYGMLLFPITNSFTSLLVFSIECNLNMLKFKKECFQLEQAKKKKYEQINKNEFDVEAQHESTLELANIKKISVFKPNLCKLLAMLRYNKIKKSRKITVLFVMSQWIVPVLVTGLLYMLNSDKSYIEGIEITKCLFDSILFPNEYCNDIKPINLELDSSALYKDYINNKDLIEEGETNSTEVNEIISKVQDIIHSAMNDAFTIPINTIFFNNSETLNITKYFEPDADIKIIEQNETFEYQSNIMQNTSSVMYNHPLEKGVPVQSIMQFYNYTVEHNNKVQLFKNLTMDSSEDKVIEENQDYSIIANATKKVRYGKSEEDIIENQVMVDDSTNISAKHEVFVPTSGQIYEDILKHIHNMPMHYLIESYNTCGKKFNKKKLKVFILKKGLQYNFITHELSEQLLIEIVNHKNSNASKIIHVYITDKCFMSIQVLKLHILVITLTIYFLPILFSSILHQYGKLNCKIILQKLHANDNIFLNTTNFNLNREINDIHSNISIESNEPSTSNQKYKDSNEHIKRPINIYQLKQLKALEEHYSKYWNEHCKNDEELNNSFDEKKMQLNMINEMRNMLKLFDTIKISLLSGILLWTPLFFILLVKIFTLLHIPEWLQTLAHLAAIAFSILRNIFNLKMIKLQETNTITVKTNSIHPAT